MRDNSLPLQVAELWSPKNVLRDSMAMRVVDGLREIFEFFQPKWEMKAQLIFFMQ